MRKTLASLALLTSLVASGAAAYAQDCCPNGKCGAYCVNCTQCGSHCSTGSCCKTKIKNKKK